MKNTLTTDRVANMRVLDRLGSLTNINTTTEQLAPLKLITARDNVHLTSDGYKSLAYGIMKEVQHFFDTKHKGTKHPNTKTTTWHNFVSYSSIGKHDTTIPTAKHNFKAPRHSTSTTNSRPYGRSCRGR